MIKLIDSPYFNTLPAFTQERIMQADIAFHNEDDLRSFVDNFESV